MNKYDVIIYGATVKGIVAAVENKRLGKNVLLLNFYGFPGGSITESLNCFQNIPEGRGLILDELTDKFRKFRNGLIFESKPFAMINHEAAKFVFQDYLEKNEIEVLYHIQPSKTIFRDDTYYLQLLGKEGIIELLADKLIDASYEHRLLTSIGITPPQIECQLHNLFLSAPSNVDSEKSEEEITSGSNQFFMLEDDRIWVSYYVNDADPLSMEKQAQNVFNYVTENIKGSGRRIQIVPAQPLIVYQYDENKNSDSNKIETLFSEEYSPEEEFFI